MKHFVTQARNGTAVYVNLIGSEASKSIARHPYLLGLVKEALEKTKLTGPHLYLDRDMGRPVGSDDVVETCDKDIILYAQALKSESYERFVKNGKPKTTQYITVLLDRDEDGGYELVDTWVGSKRPPRPGSTAETKASRPFWNNHAFVLDRKPIKPRTLTKTCPY